jgi:NADH:ubiquinone oxidoreductase subunit C
MTSIDSLSAFFSCALGQIQAVVAESVSDNQEGQTEDDAPMRLIPHDDLAVTVPSESVHEIVARLMEHCDLAHLTTITAIDEGETVTLKYHFWQEHGLTLETWLSVDDLSIKSIIDILPGAAFYEREIFGMFGVDFVGHEDLRPLLLPDGWQAGPPLRKETNDG